MISIAVRSSRRGLTPYLLAAPAFILMLSVLVYPVLNNIVQSFRTEATVFSPARFVGLANYQSVIEDTNFARSVGNTLYWTIAVTILEFVVGLYFALLLHRNVKGRGLYRGVVILPWIVPGVVAALGWLFMYNADFGVVNATLRGAGAGNLAHPWLGDPTTAMPAAIVMGTWKGFGFYMLILLAGLQNISLELYEAARIDGANRLHLFRHVTLPGLRPVIFSAILLGIIWTANYFDAIYILTGGGPARLTETLPIFIFVTAFTNFDLNEAIAASNVLLVLILILIALYLGLFSRLSLREDRPW